MQYEWDTLSLCGTPNHQQNPNPSGAEMRNGREVKCNPGDAAI